MSVYWLQLLALDLEYGQISQDQSFP